MPSLVARCGASSKAQQQAVHCGLIKAAVVQVHLLGKPAPVIYEAAMDIMGLPADQVLAVGDSISHDVKGVPALVLRNSNSTWWLTLPASMQALRQQVSTPCSLLVASTQKSWACRLKALS